MYRVFFLMWYQHQHNSSSGISILNITHCCHIIIIFFSSRNKKYWFWCTAGKRTRMEFRFFGFFLRKAKKVFLQGIYFYLLCNILWWWRKVTVLYVMFVYLHHKTLHQVIIMQYISPKKKICTSFCTKYMCYLERESVSYIFLKYHLNRFVGSQRIVEFGFL